MATFTSDSSSISTLVVSRSFIATSSIQFVTNSLHMDYGLGQGGSSSFSSFNTSGNNITASHAEGSGSKATPPFSHAEGKGNTISTLTSFGGHVEGSGSLISSPYAHVEGYNNTSSGNNTYSHIEGENNLSPSIGGHIEGKSNIGNGSAGFGYSHIEGENNSILPGTQRYTHIEGISNAKLSGYGGINLHIQGYGNRISGSNSADGACNLCGSGSYIANEFGSVIITGGHFEGGGHYINNPLRIANVHVEGLQNNISGTSLAGSTTTTEPIYGAHVGGYNNTFTGNRGSYVKGKDNSIFPPIYSYNSPVTQSLPLVYVSGLGLKAYNTASSYTQLFGQYNSSLNIGNSWKGYSYITIGGGTSDSNRSNIIEIINSQSALTGVDTPTTSYIVLPGLKAYNSNAAALAAGVPVGGLYIGKQFDDPELNTVFIAY